MTNKKRKKPSFYPQKISAKVNDEQYNWFWSKANSRKCSLSEFIRGLPNEVDNLNEEMSLMESDMNKLKEKNKLLKKEIEEIEKARAFTIDIPESWLIKDGKTVDPDDPNYSKFKKLYDKINEEGEP